MAGIGLVRRLHDDHGHTALRLTARPSPGPGIAAGAGRPSLRGGVGHTELPISRTGVRNAILLAAATASATVLLALALRRFTDSVVPFWDGITTALSLTAQYMLSRKLLENWWVWMTADVIYIALYGYKSLYLTGALYLLFFGMCIAGYAGWKKSAAARAAIRPQEVAAL